MRTSIAFYTAVLDFVHTDGDDDLSDPSFSVFRVTGTNSSSPAMAGTAPSIEQSPSRRNHVDALFRKFRERGLRTPGNPDAPEHVHEGPIDQTWGTREFYVEDPDGNTVRFIQGWHSE